MEWERHDSKSPRHPTLPLSCPRMTPLFQVKLSGRGIMATPQNSTYWKHLDFGVGRLCSSVQPAFGVLWKILETLRELSRSGGLRFHPREKR